MDAVDVDGIRSFALPFPFISFRNSFFLFAATSAFSLAALLSWIESNSESAELVLESSEDGLVLPSPKLSTGIEVVRRNLLANSDSASSRQSGTAQEGREHEPRGMGSSGRGFLILTCESLPNNSLSGDRAVVD